MKKHEPWFPGGIIPNEKPNPISVAKHYLNLIGRSPRLVERNTAYWLDGRPATITDIMRETNRLRLHDGKRQLDFNPAWVIPEIIPLRRKSRQATRKANSVVSPSAV